MLLYVHVPFCRRKCGYCAFTSWKPAEGEMERYVEILGLEIARAGELYGPADVESLFFGGGTPSLLPADLLARVLEALDKAFGLPAGIEFSFEANPDSAAEFGYLPELKRLGVNRLSLGVQSFEDRDLLMLGRPHSSRQAEGAYNLARYAGFENVGLDLIQGLPGQSLKDWMGQLARAVKLGPEHLSCYGLTLEPDTPLEKLSRVKDLGFAEPKEQAKMFLHGAEYLEEAGYLQYEISNFARMGYACRHNLGYWEGSEYLGFGPAAASFAGGLRRENPAGLEDWEALARSGELREAAEEADEETRRREMVMLSLRTARGLDLKAYRRLTGRGFLKEYEALVSALRQNDLARISSGRFRLTKEGMLVSDVIIGKFFHKTPS